MQGSTGTIGLKLARVVSVDAISITHVKIGFNLASAPRRWVLKTTADVIAQGTFDIHGDATQTFPFSPSLPVNELVFGIEDNWGLKDWTCLYRIRVHGREL